MKRYPLNPPMRRPCAAAGARLEHKLLSPNRAPLPSDDPPPHPEQLVAMAQMIGESRRRRENFFAPELFAEPGWEMLLALYSANAAGIRMSVSNLCRMSKGPPSTAVRWVDRLESLKLITRHKSLRDGRVFFVELTPDAHQRVEDYLIETWASMFDER
jgi:DNA-binding MarR family transcriptional regulator